MSKTQEKEKMQLTVPDKGALPAKIDAPTDDDLAALSGAGSEHVRPEDMATPFLLVLQDNSPQAKKSDARYVPGAEGGMFYHTLTNSVFDGQVGLEVIDCFFEPIYVRWVPRDQGGGFRGAFGPEDPQLAHLLAQAQPDPKRNLSLVLPGGDQLVNSNQHYLLARPYATAAGEVGYGGPYFPAVLPLNSTQIKKSRALNAQINLEEVRGADGSLRPIPRFGLVWRLTTIPEKNDQGSWFGVKFERLRRVTREELTRAVAFHRALAGGQKRTRPDETTAERPAEGGGAPAGGNAGTTPVTGQEAM
jgi:hypothetical protein